MAPVEPKDLLLRLLWTFLGISVVFPTLLIAGLLGALARTIVAAIARAQRPDLAEIYHDRGIIFAVESVYSKPRTTIIMNFVVNGTVSIEKLRDQFNQQLLPPATPKSDTPKAPSYAHLTQRWTAFMGYLFWQSDPNFDLQNHVRVYDYNDPELALPPVTTENDLQRITGPLLVRPFVENRSPWELLVVPKYKSSWNSDGQQQCVLILRIHHGLTDAISIFKLVLRLFDQQHVRIPEAKFVPKTMWDELKTKLWVAVNTPYDFAVKALDQWDRPNCWHLTDKKLSKQYHVFFSAPLKVAQVREAMKKHGVNFNAVIYTVTAGAMVKMMKEMGQEVPEKLATFYPYPLPNHPGGLVNHVSADFFSFYPYKSPTAPLRLQEVSQVVKPASIPVTTPVWLDWMINAIMRLPKRFVFYARSGLHFSLVMTNIAGPERQVDVMGTGKIVETIPGLSLPPGDCGACAIMVSTAGIQRICLALDHTVIGERPLPQNFTRYVQEELDELLSS